MFVRISSKTHGVKTTKEIHVVIAIWCGVFDHAKAFNDVERAKNYKRELEEASTNQRKFDVNLASVEVD